MSRSNCKSDYLRIGDLLNGASIVLNLGLTAVAMLGLPRRSAYDAWWTANGFCVSQADDRTVDTEVLCCLVLVASAIATQLFLKRSRLHKHQSPPMDPQLRCKLECSVLSNAAHGLGHLFVYFSPGPPPAIVLDWQDPMAVANLVMLLSFWVGVLRANVLSVPNNFTALGLAVIILTAQYLLQVPPNLSFTYSQSIILLAGAFDQLLLPTEQRGKFVYVLIGATYLPNMILYALEMTNCSRWLAPLGGHALYDTYLAALPFLLYGTVARHESMMSGSDKRTKVD